MRFGPRFCVISKTRAGGARTRLRTHSGSWQLFGEAFVDGYQDLIPSMKVDEKDRHVAAMAVRAGAQILVTYNRRHFPAASLAPYSIAVQHPDEFLYNLYERTPLTMVKVVRDQAAALTNPPMTPQETLDALEEVHIRRFAQAIRAHL